MKITLSILLAFLLSINNIVAQARQENRNNFLEAESWILFEAYKDALPLYQSLLKIFPDNANYKYRIGLCYLNIPGEKDKAIGYLEEAVKNINPRYREGNFREQGAPYDALYYLGNAYHVNNLLDKAIEAYTLFKENLNPRIYDSAIVSLQIRSCYNAKELMSKPVYIRAMNLGNVINGSSSEFNPVVSDNEDLIVFMRSGAFYDAILYSVKVNGQWTAPLNMNEMLRVDRDIFPTSLSHDGKTLYLYSSANYDGDIFTSTFENGIWTPMVKLNSNINTRYWESHATVSRDDQKLYFTSNRRESHGGLDIFVSTRDASGDWGVATNLGTTINTPYNEESPFLANNDKTLFFSSRGHHNMGGYDIFYSTLLDNGRWSEPINAGYPLNTTDDNLFFKPVNDGYAGYYAANRPEGFGGTDIYRIEIFNDNNPRKFLVNGIIDISGEIVKISFAKTTDSRAVQQVLSNPATGQFEAKNLPHGNYNVTFETGEGERITRTLNLPIDTESDTITMTPTIIRRTAPVAEPKAEPEIAAIADHSATVEHIAIDKDIEEQPVAQVEYPTVTSEKPAEELPDNLALKSAVEDNILTQAAVNLLVKHAVGDMKKILEDIDVEALELKSWNDLQNYVEHIADCKCASDELNHLAEDILYMQLNDNDLPDAAITPAVEKSGKYCRGLWLIIGAVLLFFIIFFLRRKKKE